MESQTDVLVLSMRLAAAFRREFAKEMAGQRWALDANLRPGCFGLLRVVAAGARSQRQIAQLMGIPASDVVSLVDRLESAGFVSRERDPDDRRRNVIVVTREGKVALRRFGKVAAVVQRRVLAPLSPEEVDHLGTLLGRVAADTDI